MDSPSEWRKELKEMAQAAIMITVLLLEMLGLEQHSLSPEKRAQPFHSEPTPSGLQRVQSTSKDASAPERMES